IARKVFTPAGLRAGLEYVDLDPGDGAPFGEAPVRTYPGALPTSLGAFSTSTVGHQILDDYAFSTPYADYDGDAKLIAIEIEKAVSAAWPWAPCAFAFVELLEPVFFRSKGAYLVGRVVRGDRVVPLVIALQSRGGCIWVDAVLLTERETSDVF